MLRQWSEIMRPQRAVAGAGLTLTLLLLPDLGMRLPAVEREKYESPYSVKFSFTDEELVGDLKGERGDAKRQSSVAHDDWYSRRIKDKYGAWGVPARHYPALPGLAEKSLKWKRERVIAVALRYQGYAYQHHHVPDWDPPRDWPWKEVALGHNSKGVDCSNFSSFVYNQGFGIKPTSAIKEQAMQRTISGPGEDRETKAEEIPLPKTYDELVKTLQTGDLLYVRNRKEEISHVVIWVGGIGQSPDRTPLILDSHGEGVKDSKGNAIPVGIYLRPFRENSWYHKSASHAHRIFHTR